MNLHLGLKESSDVETIIVNDYKSIISEISKNINYFKGKVIIATANDHNGEIVVTEDLNRILKLIVTDYFGDIEDFFLFENDTWEEAYKVTLDMKEPCDNCYNK